MGQMRIRFSLEGRGLGDPLEFAPTVFIHSGIGQIERATLYLSNDSATLGFSSLSTQVRGFMLHSISAVSASDNSGLYLEINGTSGIHVSQTGIVHWQTYSSMEVKIIAPTYGHRFEYIAYGL